MKTIVIRTVILMLILSGCSHKIKETTTLTFGIDGYPATEILKGKVKEVSETNYTANVNGNEVTKGAPLLKTFLDSIGSANYKISFDEEGLLTKNEFFDDKNEVYLTESGTIENGKYKKWDVKRSSVPFYFIPIYDNQGHISSGDVILTENDSLVQKFIQSYDSKGKVITRKITGSKGEKQNLNNFKYDASGNLIEAVSYNENDSLMLKMIYEYSKDNLLVGLNYITPEKSQKWEFKYKSWDKIGNYITYYVLLDGKPRIYAERNLVYY